MLHYIDFGNKTSQHTRSLNKLGHMNRDEEELDRPVQYSFRLEKWDCHAVADFLLIQMNDMDHLFDVICNARREKELVEYVSYDGYSR